MSLIPGSSSAPSIHPNGIASGSVATPLPLLIPYGITGQIGNVRASSSTAQTLVNSDNDIQIFTPTAAHDVNLPTTSVASGRAFYIVNRGGYALTIKSSGGDTVVSPSTGTVTNGVYLVRALQAAPTTAAHWQVEYVYEPGTFTPSVAGSSTAGTYNYTFRQGSYMKIGNKVSCDIFLNWTTSGADGTGNMIITGLPFTSSASQFTAGTIGYITNVGLTASNYAMAYVPSSSANIEVVQSAVGGGANASVPIDHNGGIIINVCYRV